MQKWRRDNDVERYRRNALGPTGPDAAADAMQEMPARRRAKVMTSEGSLVGS